MCECECECGCVSVSVRVRVRECVSEWVCECFSASVGEYVSA